MKLFDFIKSKAKHINDRKIMDKELKIAFEFYIKILKRKFESEDLLIANKVISKNISYFRLQEDIKKLESGDIEVLFRIMLKDEKFKWELIDEQIEKIESFINSQKWLLEHLDEEWGKGQIEYYYKSKEEAMAQTRNSIRENEINIIRLHGGDYELCCELMRDNREN